MGERTPVATLSATASARLAIGEVITNLAAAPIADIGEIKLSANWMAAIGVPGEDAALYDAVQAVGSAAVPAARHLDLGREGLVVDALRYGSSTAASRRRPSPVSLIATGFARIADARQTLTPQLRTDAGPSELWLIDLGAGKNRSVSAARC